MNNFLQKVKIGFKNVKVSEKYKKIALKNIEKWLTDDMFTDYQDQIKYLIDNKKFELLLDSFYQVIPFGTGGRRGPVGIGPNRINPWTIKASAQGHSEYLIKQHKDAKERGIVIAYDVRQYPETDFYDDSIPNPVKGITSKQLAQEAVKVYTANGIKIYFFEEITTTPELSFAIRHLKAIAGINISASHNPKEDNGKKVYAKDGSQLIPPFDEILADTVNNVKSINENANNKLIQNIGKEINDAYLAVTTTLTNFPKERNIKILFSPLHGVGTKNVYDTFKKLGFDISLDPDTKTPDGNFTNVKFNIPNPEVKESFETCYKNAKDHDIILNTDPDADRMGISVKHKGEWHYLNGQQIGTIITAALLNVKKEENALTSDSLVIKTLVTTEIITKICKTFNVKIIGDLLVGFKYIGHEIRELEKKGKENNFVIALEESHGYLSGTYCRDKDGVAACLILAELASQLKSKGNTIIDYLDDIYKKYGYNDNVLSLIMLLGAMGMEQMQGLMDTIRKNKPEKIGRFIISTIEDRWDGPKHLSETDTMSRNVLIFNFKPEKGLDEIKLAIRPSGTQPVIKIYFEIMGQKGKNKEEIIETRKELRNSFLKYCYDILKIDLPERGYFLSDLLPVPIKMDYFKIEEELISKKDELNEEQIFDLLKPLGQDPIEKVDECFIAKHKKPFREYFGLK